MVSWLALAPCCVVLAWARGASEPQAAVLLALVASSMALSWRCGRVVALSRELHALQDDLQDRVLDLREKNRELEDARAWESHAAALAERKEVLSNADKGVISPYNTYTNAGLPAGPIANPGMNSIRAALYPAETNYYFYALNADGIHHFSETYYEHQNFLAELAGKTQPDEEQTDAPADGEETTDTENQTDGQT